MKIEQQLTGFKCFKDFKQMRKNLSFKHMRKKLLCFI